MSKEKTLKTRKQRPSNDDLRNVSHTHVPKNKYKRDRLNPQEAFDEYMKASQELQGDDYWLLK